MNKDLYWCDDTLYSKKYDRVGVVKWIEKIQQWSAYNPDWINYYSGAFDTEKEARDWLEKYVTAKHLYEENHVSSK